MVMFNVALALLFLFLEVSTVFAVRTIEFSGNVSSLFGDETLILTASASGFTEGETIYLKGAFYQNGTFNYFGFTQNGDTWIKNSASNASQRAVKIGEWDGYVVVKNDFGDSGYMGEGDYMFKLRFYYGPSFTADWSTNAVNIALNEPDPTITPTPTPTNTPTPLPAATTAPTVIPTVVMHTLVPTKTPTQIPIPTSTISATPTNSSSLVILGSSSAVAVPATPAARSTKPLMIALLLVAMGLALLAGVLVWQKKDIWKNSMTSPKE